MKIELTKQDSDFSSVQWVLNALTKDKTDSRYYSNHVIITDSMEMVATDTYRLHKAQLENLTNKFKPGSYEVLKKTKGAIVLFACDCWQSNEYPDFELIFNYTHNVTTINSSGDVDKTYTEIIRLMTDNTFQYRFINDVLSSDCEFDIDIDPEGNHAVYFKNQNKIAAIMPMRM